MKILLLIIFSILPSYQLHTTSTLKTFNPFIIPIDIGYYQFVSELQKQDLTLDDFNIKPQIANGMVDGQLVGTFTLDNMKYAVSISFKMNKYIKLRIFFEEIDKYPTGKSAYEYYEKVIHFLRRHTKENIKPTFVFFGGYKNVPTELYRYFIRHGAHCTWERIEGIKRYFFEWRYFEHYVIEYSVEKNSDG